MELMRYYQLNEALKKEKKRLNKNLRWKNRKLIFILDILVIVSIVFNLGAMVMTNALVVKQVPEIEIVEANPVQAKVNDYKAPPPQVATKFMFNFYFNLIAWALIIGTYIYWRKTIFDDRGLSFLGLYTMFVIIVFGLDFFNNLGFFIGKILYGG